MKPRLVPRDDGFPVPGTIQRGKDGDVWFIGWHFDIEGADEAWSTAELEAIGRDCLAIRELPERPGR